jgi:hypothetical protein
LRTARLDLGKVIAGAFLVPWWHRKAFARALALPLALLVVYGAVWNYFAKPVLTGFAPWLIYAVYGMLFTMFAVTCHRLVLLDAESVAKRWQPRWSLRETRFFIWILGLWASGLVAMMILLLIAVNLWTWTAGGRPEWIDWAQTALKVPLLYVFARLFIVFPAMALDQRPSLRWAWERTQGNGWRLVVIVAGLPVAFKYLVDLLFRSEATEVEWLMLTVLTVALFAVEIAAISLSYRELTKEAP